ncbi:hypothetical protein NDU88_007979 [Pleurodeles waltl]|uniref:Uncharacterized protein n=1 Tax=Pleurodeles waltl TaxID=8319 RepID=A0AAV7VR87_PLEWA|nr:hypothetical protein NDU88_007979 [Pleurodeles waltl]
MAQRNLNGLSAPLVCPSLGEAKEEAAAAAPGGSIAVDLSKYSGLSLMQLNELLEDEDKLHEISLEIEDVWPHTCASWMAQRNLNGLSAPLVCPSLGEAKEEAAAAAPGGSIAVDLSKFSGLSLMQLNELLEDEDKLHEISLEIEDVWSHRSN